MIFICNLDQSFAISHIRQGNEVLQLISYNWVEIQPLEYPTQFFLLVDYEIPHFNIHYFKVNLKGFYMLFFNGRKVELSGFICFPYIRFQN